MGSFGGPWWVVKGSLTHSDRPVGLVVSDPDCKAGGRGFDSHPGQTLCHEHNCLFYVWV